MTTFSVRGRLGGPLSVSITEKVVDYEPLHRKRFHDGGWRQALPPREALNPERYADQAQAGIGKRKNVYHFAEISAFNLLLREGMDDAFYERYLLFCDPPVGADARYRVGTREVRELMGEEKYNTLRELGTRYPLPKSERPKEPDLLAFKRQPDGSVSFRAVEAKIDDPVADSQLLGLALIHKVLGCDVEIWRFHSLGREKRSAQTYTCNFEPARSG